MKKILLFIAIIFSTHTQALEFQGKFLQGHFILGKAKIGSKIFIDEWGDLPIGVDRKIPINQIYSNEIIESLINGLAVGTRWGAKEGQLPVAAKLVNSGLMNRLMMEYINGDRSAEDTVDMLNSEAAKL